MPFLPTFLLVAALSSAVAAAADDPLSRCRDTEAVQGCASVAVLGRPAVLEVRITGIPDGWIDLEFEAAYRGQMTAIVLVSLQGPDGYGLPAGFTFYGAPPEQPNKGTVSLPAPDGIRPGPATVKVEVVPAAKDAPVLDTVVHVSGMRVR